MDVQDTLLAWAAGATRDERYEFLKRYLDILPYPELHQVLNNVSKAKKRRKRQRDELTDVSQSVPEKSVSELVTSVSPSKKEEPPLKKQSKWFHNFKKSSIVALDCEKVEYQIIGGIKKKFTLKAATVSVVDYNGNVIYDKKIYHKKGAYRVTKYSFAKNGIAENSLENGASLEIVQRELRDLLSGKLVVLLNGEGDFSSLDLPLGDFEYFDCVHFWYRQETSSKGKPIYEDLGLRSLCHHYFGEDMQPPGVIHEASNDAVWTMRLFRDIYTKHPANDSKINPTPSNEIPHYKSCK